MTLVRNILRYRDLRRYALRREHLPSKRAANRRGRFHSGGYRRLRSAVLSTQYHRRVFILFEGQYNVGDFITVEPTKASGLVEEFGLRTTKIRAPSGELTHIPNDTITGVTNYVSGQQRFTIEVQPKDEEAANRVLEEMQEGHELYLTPPHLMKRDETPDGGPRLRLLAGVLSSTAWLVEENLVERIKAAAGEDGLVADPLVYKIDDRTFSV